MRLPFSTPRRENVGRVVLAMVGVAVVACSSGPSAPAFDGSIPLGTWGGDNSGMIVGDTAVHIHVGCTYGDVSGRVPVSADGVPCLRGLRIGRHTTDLERCRTRPPQNQIPEPRAGDLHARPASHRLETTV